MYFKYYFDFNPYKDNIFVNIRISVRLTLLFYRRVIPPSPALHTRHSSCQSEQRRAGAGAPWAHFYGFEQPDLIVSIQTEALVLTICIELNGFCNNQYAYNFISAFVLV